MQTLESQPKPFLVSNLEKSLSIETSLTKSMLQTSIPYLWPSLLSKSSKSKISSLRAITTAVVLRQQWQKMILVHSNHGFRISDQQGSTFQTNWTSQKSKTSTFFASLTLRLKFTKWQKSHLSKRLGQEDSHWEFTDWSIDWTTEYWRTWAWHWTDLNRYQKCYGCTLRSREKKRRERKIMKEYLRSSQKYLKAA